MFRVCEGSISDQYQFTWNEKGAMLVATGRPFIPITEDNICKLQRMSDCVLPCVPLALVICAILFLITVIPCCFIFSVVYGIFVAGALSAYIAAKIGIKSYTPIKVFLRSGLWFYGYGSESDYKALEKIALKAVDKYGAA